MLEIIGGGESSRTLMREIKFRIWNGKRFIKNTQSNFITLTGDVVNPVTLDLWKNKIRIIQQFTGLKDSEGNDIYEGDILNIRGHILPEKVIFAAGSFGVHLNYKHSIDGRRKDNNPEDVEPLSYWNEGELKIIGNVFESSELV